MDAPAVSVVVPTRDRAGYLKVALETLLVQHGEVEHELLVVDDGPSEATREVADVAGVRCVANAGARGLNGARNTGIGETRGKLIAFVDDDVSVPPGWLEALAGGAERHPEADAFGGPIRARLEGSPPAACG